MPKTQLSKVMQLEGLVGRLLGPLLKTGLPIIKSVTSPLAKKFLIALGLTAAADAGIFKKILGSGHNKTLIISNEEMKDILKIVRSLEGSGSLLKGVSETIKNEVKEEKRGFLSMLLVCTQRSYKRQRRNLLELTMDLRDFQSNELHSFYHIL